MASPSVVFADEPTGNLDTAKSHEIMQLLKSLNAERGLTIVLVTHEEDVASYAGRQVRFHDGLIASDTRTARDDLERVPAGACAKSATICCAPA